MSILVDQHQSCGSFLCSLSSFDYLISKYNIRGRYSVSKYPNSIKMPSTHISGEEEFRTRIDKAGTKLVVVDFSATWCGPCKTIAPFFETLSDRFKHKAEFLKVDINECPEIATKNNVMTLPTFLFFKNGEVVNRIRGSDPSSLEAKVVELTGKPIPTIGGAASKGYRPTADDQPDQGLAGLVSGLLQAAVPSDQTPRNFSAFKGEGQRLGDQPDVKKPESETAFAGTTSTGGGWFSGWFKSKKTDPVDLQDAQAKMKVDELEPVTQIQIKLADGSRLIVKLNLAQQISKIRDFILANRPEYSSSTFVLMTALPKAEILNESMSVKEAKVANSVVHQKLL